MPFGGRLGRSDPLITELPTTVAPSGGRLVPFVNPHHLENCSDKVVEAYVRMFEADTRAYEVELQLKKTEVELQVVEGRLKLAELECRTDQLSSPMLSGRTTPARGVGVAGSGCGSCAGPGRGAATRAWRSGVVGRAQSVVSWRSGASSSVSGFSTEGGAEPAAESRCDSGRCYSSLAVEGGKSALTRRCGRWPTVSRLLALPVSALSVASLDLHVLVRSTGDDWHVAPAGESPPATATVSDVLGRMVREFDDLLEVGDSRWDGTLLQLLRSRPEPLGTFPLPDLKSRVGGVSGGDSRSEAVEFEAYPCVSGRTSVPTVYLGGSVEKDRLAVGWRTEFFSQAGLAFPPCLLLSPRPLSGSFLDADDVKRDWERRAMDESSVIVLHFLSGSGSSVSLLELGLYASSGKLVVCCPPGYFRYDSVRHTCSAAGVPLFQTSAEVVGYVARVLGGDRSAVLGLSAPVTSVVSRGAASVSPTADTSLGDSVGLSFGSKSMPLDLEWDSVGGFPVVSAFERKVGSSDVLVAVFQCSRMVYSLCFYTFRVPGEKGVARLKRSSCFDVRRPAAKGPEYYDLLCGVRYTFSVSYTLTSFVPTFEYDLGSCSLSFRHCVGGTGASGLWAGLRSAVGFTVSCSYLALFDESWRPCAAARLGPHPSLRSLLSFPVPCYLSGDSLLEYSFFRVGRGIWVVDEIGESGSVLGCVAGYESSGSRFPLASLCRARRVAVTGHALPGLDHVVY